MGHDHQRPASVPGVELPQDGVLSRRKAAWAILRLRRPGRRTILAVWSYLICLTCRVGPSVAGGELFLRSGHEHPEAGEPPVPLPACGIDALDRDEPPHLVRGVEGVPPVSNGLLHEQQSFQPLQTSPDGRAAQPQVVGDPPLGDGRMFRPGTVREERVDDQVFELELARLGGQQDEKVLLVRERTPPVVVRHEHSFPRDGRSQTKWGRRSRTRPPAADRRLPPRQLMIGFFDVSPFLTSFLILRNKSAV